MENFNHQASQHIWILNWISSQTQIHKITNSSELFLNIFLIKCVCSYTGSKQNEQEIPYISQIKDNFKGFSTVIYFLEFHYSFNELKCKTVCIYLYLLSPSATLVVFFNHLIQFFLTRKSVSMIIKPRINKMVPNFLYWKKISSDSDRQELSNKGLKKDSCTWWQGRVYL